VNTARPATSIYIASPEGETGKSTIALGILHRLSALVPKVGVFRPIARREDTDYVLELLLAQSNAGLSYADCVGVTYQRMHADPEAAIADSVDRYLGVAERCVAAESVDFLLDVLARVRGRIEAHMPPAQGASVLAFFARACHLTRSSASRLLTLSSLLCFCSFFVT
jgi:phosphate acetyltransferase